MCELCMEVSKSSEKSWVSRMFLPFLWKWWLIQELQAEKLNPLKFINGIFVTLVKYGRKVAGMKQLTKLLNKCVKICNDLPLLQHSQGFCSSCMLWEINCYDLRAQFCKCHLAGIIPLTALTPLLGSLTNTWCFVSQFWNVKVVLNVTVNAVI